MMNLLLPILNAFLILLVAVAVYRRQPHGLQKFYWPALLFKFAAGFGMGWLYLGHYGGGDTLSFWQEGCRLADILMDRPIDALKFLWNEAQVTDLQQQFSGQGPRSLFFVKICGLLALVSGGNYWVMGAWLSLIAFEASWLLVVRVEQTLPAMTAAILLVILFFPSVVFWSSGLIKESLGLASLYLLATVMLSVVMHQKTSLLEIVMMPLALWIGWNLKYYWLGIFLPVAVPVVVVALASRWRTNLRRYDLALWFGLVLVSLVVATQSHPNFYVSRFLEVICQNNLEFTQLSDPPRLVQYYNLEPELGSVFMNAPAALIAGLFRPFPWEVFNALSMISAIENLIILMVVLQSLPAVTRLWRSEHRVLVMAALTYTILLIVFLALSTPNFGTLSRYRIGALPFLLLVCLTPLTPWGRWLASRRWFG